MIRPLLTALLILSLAGCGFHLREGISVPTQFGAVRVVSVDRFSPLAESLAQTFERGGATVVRDGEAGAVLDILAEQWGDTPISVDAFGRAQEFSLRYAVIFEFRRADGTVLVPRQTIELARDYVSNPVNSIGTEGEREILGRELRREMAASVVRRIDAVFKSGVPVQGLLPIPEPAVAPSPADAAAGNPGG